MERNIYSTKLPFLIFYHYISHYQKLFNALYTSLDRPSFYFSQSFNVKTSFP